MSRKTSAREEPVLYLNLIWHQHQPLYVDPESDELLAPWVRTHATKDYYSMPALLRQYPEVHCTINLTPVLLLQLLDYYVARLKGLGQVKLNGSGGTPTREKKGLKTDPWTDLALKDTASFTSSEKAIFTEGLWNSFGVSEPVMRRFPEYQLVEKRWRAGDNLTEKDFRSLKFWFLLANFHPMFLNAKVRLTDGATIDLRPFLQVGHDGKYYLRKTITEADCKGLVLSAWKIMKNIVPIHKKLMYEGSSAKARRKYSGQIELSTTPFYHPILPLLVDSDVARVCQPGSPLPKRFHFLLDAELQIKLALRLFKKVFGEYPKGIWPAEGAVSHGMLDLLVKHGVLWVASDEKVLARSKPAGLSKYKPHAMRMGKSKAETITVFFRDTELSDKIGFVYKDQSPRRAVEDFVRTLLKHSPGSHGDDRIVTVALDGENAWEWYQYDPEGEAFLRGVYQKLSELSRQRKVVTTTPSEYLEGNPRRGIPRHLVHSLPVIESLWPGSWINANFDTWIGEEQKNIAWNLLREARVMMERSELSAETLIDRRPVFGTKRWYARRAWDALLAAEGSDWFWWMGSELNQSGKRAPMAELFLKHLSAVYNFAERAGAKVARPDFSSLTISSQRRRQFIGTMRRGETPLVKVRFQCDARAVNVPQAIYIVGNHPSLGSWMPNKVRMYDDGTHGDKQAGDGVWTLEVELPVDTEVIYKFTNSGRLGSWDPGDEMPGVNRRLHIGSSAVGVLESLDVLGRL